MESCFGEKGKLMKHLRSIVLWGLPPVLLGGCVWSCFQSLEPTIGHAVVAEEAPFDGLPATPTNIRYYLPGVMGLVVVFEFDISEAEFGAWATEVNVPSRMELAKPVRRGVRVLDATGRPHAEREILDGH